MHETGPDEPDVDRGAAARQPGAPGPPGHPPAVPGPHLPFDAHREGRDPPDLQLGGLPVAPTLPGVRGQVQQVRRQGQPHDLQRHRRRCRQALRRPGGPRRLLPGSVGAHEARRVEAPPAAPARPAPQPRRELLVGVPEPVLRPAVAIHRSVHRLHDRHRVPKGSHPGLEDPIDVQPLRDPVGSGIQGPGDDLRRPPGDHVDGAHEERDQGREHGRPQAHRHGQGRRPEADRCHERPTHDQRRLREDGRGRVLGGLLLVR